MIDQNFDSNLRPKSKFNFRDMNNHTINDYNSEDDEDENEENKNDKF